jgi:hypothetical protein
MFSASQVEMGNEEDQLLAQGRLCANTSHFRQRPWTTTIFNGSSSLEQVVFYQV